ncbi:MAG: alpha-L-fucosidase [Verrucomicrobia bacterium]|nr:alpha-L-fucosidase [Verrucomicrobiota bacterium]
MPRKLACLLTLLALAASTRAAPPPAPYGALPTERQLLAHARAAFAFVHFTTNTFTDREWGYGDESPAVFNPTAFDPDQIVGAAKDADLRGVILTAKHHDGFCLWPSKFTEHSVKHSPWKNGRGDVVREMADACRRAGLEFGVYLSPWDRNRADYGQPSYIEYYRHQLRELLTNYGPIFEVWFDGANGGDGYYGGAREKRKIDNTTYYDWPNTWKIVRELQPLAVMFSDAGPDVRWVGNERGIAGDPCWATIDAAGYFPGKADSKILNSGTRGGAMWLPAEVDVSIRPGWFYHEKEDARVKTVSHLLQIYFESVGRGATLNLNLPPDRRGQIPAGNVATLREFGRVLRETFARNLAAGATATATNTRGRDATFAPANVLPKSPSSPPLYWSTDDTALTPTLTLDLARPTTFDVVRLREHIAVGQRVDTFTIEIWERESWRQIAAGTAIGGQRLVRLFSPVTTTKVRVRFSAVACPAISEVSLFALAAVRDP